MTGGCSGRQESGPPALHSTAVQSRSVTKFLSKQKVGARVTHTVKSARSQTDQIFKAYDFVEFSLGL